MSDKITTAEVEALLADLTGNEQIRFAHPLFADGNGKVKLSTMAAFIGAGGTGLTTITKTDFITAFMAGDLTFGWYKVTSMGLTMLSSSTLGTAYVFCTGETDSNGFSIILNEQIGVINTGSDVIVDITWLPDMDEVIRVEYKPARNIVTRKAGSGKNCIENFDVTGTIGGGTEKSEVHDTDITLIHPAHTSFSQATIKNSDLTFDYCVFDGCYVDTVAGDFTSLSAGGVQFSNQSQIINTEFVMAGTMLSPDSYVLVQRSVIKESSFTSSATIEIQDNTLLYACSIDATGGVDPDDSSPIVAGLYNNELTGLTTVTLGNLEVLGCNGKRNDNSCIIQTGTHLAIFDSCPFNDFELASTSISRPNTFTGCEFNYGSETTADDAVSGIDGSFYKVKFSQTNFSLVIDNYDASAAWDANSNNRLPIVSWINSGQQLNGIFKNIEFSDFGNDGLRIKRSINGQIDNGSPDALTFSWDISSFANGALVSVNNKLTGSFNGGSLDLSLSELTQRCFVVSAVTATLSGLSGKSALQVGSGTASADDGTTTGLIENKIGISAAGTMNFNAELEYAYSNG